ncbi:hypothetical protein T492DRAFT_1056647 [Pavlovales sp. CCMP2436]|nr:hypothetical protein T492DRAFT_1056647 [Pavlovales sp. CCMP2436]|mmetsp:Transcript_43440/g.102028  ORF Transcript_43440/g.102028 Transcript_43440/m.102028 type:complete len:191 (+) Transcript_43440:296-868(+)
MSGPELRVTHSGGALDSPSALLRTYARHRIQRGDGLVSFLSEHERAVLADELVQTGWRGHSPVVRRAVQHVLAEGSRRILDASSSQLLQEGSGLDQPSFASEPAFGIGTFRAKHAAMTLGVGDVWLPTAADYEMMGRAQHVSKTRKSKHDGTRQRRARAADCEVVEKLPYFEEEWNIAEGRGAQRQAWAI